MATPNMPRQLMLKMFDAKQDKRKKKIKRKEHLAVIPQGLGAAGNDSTSPSLQFM